MYGTLYSRSREARKQTRMAHRHRVRRVSDYTKPNRYEVTAMKRSLILGAILIALLGLSFLIGYLSGVEHAIIDSKMSVESHEILIELDGQLYTHEI